MKDLISAVMDTHRSVQATMSKYAKPALEYEGLSEDKKKQIHDIIISSFKCGLKRPTVVTSILSLDLLNPEDEEEYDVYRIWLDKYITILRKQFDLERKSHDRRRR